jgi:hypothetical protein
MVGLTLVLEVDSGAIASITDYEVANFQTLADFQKQFRYIDLNAFMAKHNITTVDELRERYQYLRSEIQLSSLATFDPNDPANQHSYTLNIAIFIRDAIDVAATLRDAKLARHAIEQALAYQREVDVSEVQTPYAPFVIFSQAALNGLPFNASALQTFFAAEGILAVFVNDIGALPQIKCACLLVGEKMIRKGTECEFCEFQLSLAEFSRKCCRESRLKVNQ